MNCCQRQGLEEMFNQEEVAKELARYRVKGPPKTTSFALVQALKAEGVRGLTLLDIGGGVGSIQHELIGAGAETAVDVDASRAYLQAARSEARRRGIEGRIQFEYGDFVEIAGSIPAADVVTLDRVICCYHDMKNLVALSAQRTRKLVGLVYPRDTWFTRAALAFMNLVYRLQKSTYRGYVHSAKTVERIIRDHGFQRRFLNTGLIWQVEVYVRI